MAFVGDNVGQWLGEWLGQALNPGAMYANIGGGGALSAYTAEDNTGDGIKRRHISPAYAKKLIEARLRSIAASSPKKKAKHAARVDIPAVAIDDIAKQSKEIAKLEQEALVNIAVQEVITMQSRLDAEIKAEFAAMQIAAQLAIFEEEVVFMFMTATEA